MIDWESKMDDWKTYTDSELAVELDFPDPTPEGIAVMRHVRRAESSYRVHFVSEGSDEVYFEIGRYRNLAPKDAIRDFLDDVTSRLDQLRTSEVEPTNYQGMPAHQFSIRWPGKQRTILLIESGSDLYRVIHDPRSSINRMMLDTLRFL